MWVSIYEEIWRGKEANISGATHFQGSLGTIGAGLEGIDTTRQSGHVLMYCSASLSQQSNQIFVRSLRFIALLDDPWMSPIIDSSTRSG